MRQDVTLIADWLDDLDQTNISAMVRYGSVEWLRTARKIATGERSIMLQNPDCPPWRDRIDGGFCPDPSVLALIDREIACKDRPHYSVMYESVDTVDIDGAEEGFIRGYVVSGGRQPIPDGLSGEALQAWYAEQGVDQPLEPEDPECFEGRIGDGYPPLVLGAFKLIKHYCTLETYTHGSYYHEAGWDDPMEIVTFEGLSDEDLAKLDTLLREYLEDRRRR